MQYAISAGTIVLRERHLLLVHHRGEGYDFWLPPGGRLRGEESIFDCAARETLEETGLRVVPQRILYVEEFIEETLHFCKFWLLASDPGGTPSVASRDPDEAHLIDAHFVSRDAMRSLVICPRMLQGTFWDDLANGFPETRYLGLQRI
jgi:8-oxo-dGTP diphosphatase